MRKNFCDKCGNEIEGKIDSILFIRVGEREIEDKELCSLCLIELEEYLRRFFGETNDTIVEEEAP